MGEGILLHEALRLKRKKRKRCEIRPAPSSLTRVRELDACLLEKEKIDYLAVVFKGVFSFFENALENAEQCRAMQINTDFLGNNAE